MTTQTKDINMISGGVRSYVNVSQYDVGSEIKFALYNNSSAFTPPVGTTVRVEGRKPDGNGFSYSASLSDNVVTVTVTDQMTVLSGEVLCELRLTKDSVDIGTANFILAVEEAPINSDIPISDTEIPAIIELARQEQYTAEAWAKGTRNGEPVSSSDPTYHNNSKYWADQAQGKIREAVKEKTTTTGVFETITGGKLESCIVAFEPIQSGSGTPSPDNVRPITGHSSVEVGNVGKNLMPPEIEYLDVAHNYFKTSNDVLVKSGTYTASFLNGSSNSSKLIVNKIVGGTETTIANVTVNSNSRGSATVTLTDDTYIRIGGRFDPASAISDLSVFSQIQLEEGSTTTTYEPYQGQDITISLEQTVYGGSLDVVSGMLTVTWTGQRLLSSMNWVLNTQYEGERRIQYRYDLQGLIPIGISSSNNISSHLEWENTNVHAFGTFYMTDQWLVIPDKDSYMTDLQAFKDWLTDENVYICYELKTPLTIQLTPQQINTLIGENHLDVPLEGQTLDSAVYRELFAWDDVKDVVELRLPISAIGTDESNNDNASQAYSQGDYFYKNGIAKAKTNIASGATFTLGTNYEIKTLAEILKALES